MLVAIGNDSSGPKRERAAEMYGEDVVKPSDDDDPDKVVEECSGVVVFGSLTGPEIQIWELAEDAGLPVHTW